MLDIIYARIELRSRALLFFRRLSYSSYTLSSVNISFAGPHIEKVFPVVTASWVRNEYDTFLAYLGRVLIKRVGSTRYLHYEDLRYYRQKVIQLRHIVGLNKFVSAFNLQDALDVIEEIGRIPGVRLSKKKVGRYKDMLTCLGPLD